MFNEITNTYEAGQNAYNALTTTREKYEALYWEERLWTSTSRYNQFRLGIRAAAIENGDDKIMKAASDTYHALTDGKTGPRNPAGADNARLMEWAEREKTRRKRIYFDTDSVTALQLAATSTVELAGALDAVAQELLELIRLWTPENAKMIHDRVRQIAGQALDTINKMDELATDHYEATFKGIEVLTRTLRAYQRWNVYRDEIQTTQDGIGYENLAASMKRARQSLIEFLCLARENFLNAATGLELDIKIGWDRAQVSQMLENMRPTLDKMRPFAKATLREMSDRQIRRMTGYVRHILELRLADDTRTLFENIEVELWQARYAVTADARRDSLIRVHAWITVAAELVETRQQTS